MHEIADLLFTKFFKLTHFVTCLLVTRILGTAPRGTTCLRTHAQIDRIRPPAPPTRVPCSAGAVLPSFTGLSCCYLKPFRAFQFTNVNSSPSSHSQPPPLTHQHPPTRRKGQQNELALSAPRRLLRRERNHRLRRLCQGETRRAPSNRRASSHKDHG